MITASALPRLDVCPASGALPEVRGLDTPELIRGRVVHAFLDRCADGDRDAALAEVPEEYREFCEGLDVGRLPFDLSHPSVVTEVAYAYDVATGAARRLGRRIDRRYGNLAATEIAGSLDVLIVDHDCVHVRDWKVGWGSDLLAPPPERNLQLRAYALMAARAEGVERATIGRIRITESAEFRIDDPVHLDAFDLDDVADQVARVHAQVERAREEILTGRQPSVDQSDWCRYCPAFSACPAQTQLVRQIAAAPEEIERFVGAHLTTENAARAWERIRLIEEVVGRARRAVENFAREHPIDLGNGRMLALTTTTRETIDAGLALPILREKFGEDVADAAARLTTTKALLRDALKGYSQRAGISLTKAEHIAMSLLRDAGAVHESVSESVRECRLGRAS